MHKTLKMTYFVVASVSPLFCPSGAVISLSSFSVVVTRVVTSSLVVGSLVVGGAVLGVAVVTLDSTEGHPTKSCVVEYVRY